VCAVVGWGEGGMLALYSAALDPRIDVTCVAAISNRAKGSGDNRSTATSLVCSNNSAMRSWQR